VRHGGITKAGAELRLRPPTLSAQIRQLEEALGERLFSREGRRLVLTEAGRMVYGYADEIFSLGRELLDTVKRKAGPSRLRLVVGVADAIPTIVALRLLEPALAISEPVRVVCREGRHEKLLAAIQRHGKRVFGEDMPAVGVPLYADARLYGEHGVPIVMYGAGPRTIGESNAKRPDENLLLEDLRRATHVVAGTVYDLLRG